MKLFILLIIVESLSPTVLLIPDDSNIFTEEWSSTQAKLYTTSEEEAFYDVYVHMLYNSGKDFNTKYFLYSIDTDSKVVEEIPIPPLVSDSVYIFNSFRR
ncbi:MAG: hypothetical protein WC438_06440 [Candidatus Pacearchaeota archaeon]